MTDICDLGAVRSPVRSGTGTSRRERWFRQRSAASRPALTSTPSSRWRPTRRWPRRRPQTTPCRGATSSASCMACQYSVKDLLNTRGVRTTMGSRLFADNVPAEDAVSVARARIFGGNVFGWTVDEAASFRLLDALLDNGLTAIDTADVYSNWVPGHVGGESEAILGKWMKTRGVRARMTIATKVGMRMGDGREGLSAAWIERAAEDSLRRLQTDHIDLYQAHEDYAGTPLEETLEAFGRLVEQGKVRAIGASNYSAARLREAARVADDFGLASFATLQPLYNLIERNDFDQSLAPTCRDLGLAVITYSSLAAGFLTGKYRSADDVAGSARSHRVSSWMTAENLRILDALDVIAKVKGASIAQVALAWLMAQPSVTAPIASATSVEQIGDLVAATALTLTADDLTSSTGYLPRSEGCVTRVLSRYFWQAPYCGVTLSGDEAVG